jgi:hypothetical protein
MKVTRLDMGFCPYCNHKLDAASAGPNNPQAVPKPGDITICIGCANVLIFDVGRRPQRPTMGELQEAMQDPSVLRAIQIIRHVIRDKL